MLTTKKQIIKAFPNGIKKLEIGSGKNPESDYVHLDIQISAINLDILGDVRNMPIPDNFVSEEIRAVHIMEHFCHPEYASIALKKKFGTTIEILKECYRVLKPGGKLKIVTPDFQKIGYSVVKNKVEMHWLQRWAVGGHENDYDIHHWLWTEDDAIKWFKKTGFKNLNNWNPIQSWKKKLTLQWSTNDYKSRDWFDIEWYHWLFFEGTK